MHACASSAGGGRRRRQWQQLITLPRSMPGRQHLPAQPRQRAGPARPWRLTAGRARQYQGASAAAAAARHATAAPMGGTGGLQAPLLGARIPSAWQGLWQPKHRARGLCPFKQGAAMSCALAAGGQGALTAVWLKAARSICGASLVRAAHSAGAAAGREAEATSACAPIVRASANMLGGGLQHCRGHVNRGDDEGQRGEHRREVASLSEAATGAASACKLLHRPRSAPTESVCVARRAATLTFGVLATGDGAEEGASLCHCPRKHRDTTAAGKTKEERMGQGMGGGGPCSMRGIQAPHAWRPRNSD